MLDKIVEQEKNQYLKDDVVLSTVSHLSRQKGQWEEKIPGSTLIYFLLYTYQYRIEIIRQARSRQKGQQGDKIAKSTVYVSVQYIYNHTSREKGQ